MKVSHINSDLAGLMDGWQGFGTGTDNRVSNPLSDKKFIQITLHLGQFRPAARFNARGTPPLAHVFLLPSTVGTVPVAGYILPLDSSKPGLVRQIGLGYMAVPAFFDGRLAVHNDANNPFPMTDNYLQWDWTDDPAVKTALAARSLFSR